MIRRRVLFVSHSGALGGAERSLLDLAAAWGDACEVVLLADGPAHAAFADRGVRVSVEPLGALGSVRREGGFGARPAADLLRVAGRLASRARAAEIVHANTQKGFAVGAMAAAFARRPIVWHLRDILSPEHFGARNIRAIRWLANRRAARVIANSKATAAAFAAAGGDPRLVRVVYNGIDPTPFDRTSPEDAALLRRSLGAGQRWVLAACGRLSPWKGQHVVLEALTEIPDAEAWIVGEALFGEEDYARSLPPLAARLGVADRVRFLGERQDVPGLMRAADVVVHASTAAEPFGRVVVEGMFAERPVVATRAGGVLELVRPRENGWLAEPGDAKSLAAAVREILADPRGAAAVARRARDEARERFRIDAMVEAVDRVLDEASAR